MLDPTRDDGDVAPPIIPFDSFSRQLIEVDKKWITTCRRLSFAASLRELAAKNPFRIYLSITALSNFGRVLVYPEGLDTTGDGYIFINEGYFREFYPAKDGSLTTGLWIASSPTNESLIITETIYRGNTDQRS